MPIEPADTKSFDELVQIMKDKGAKCLQLQTVFAYRICSKNFEKREDLFKHKEEEHGKVTLSCPKCKYQNQDERRMREHINQHKTTPLAEIQNHPTSLSSPDQSPSSIGSPPRINITIFQPSHHQKGGRK